MLFYLRYLELRLTSRRYAGTDFYAREVSFKAHPICLFFLCFLGKMCEVKKKTGGVLG